jgi:hypothetical protein
MCCEASRHQGNEDRRLSSRANVHRDTYYDEDTENLRDPREYLYEGDEYGNDSLADFSEPHIDNFGATSSLVQYERSRIHGHYEMITTRSIPGRGLYSYVLPIDEKHDSVSDSIRGWDESTIQYTPRNQQEKYRVPLPQPTSFNTFDVNMAMSYCNSVILRRLEREARQLELSHDTKRTVGLDIERNTASSFQYSPIDHDHEIRLIHIARSGPLSTINCSFIPTRSRFPGLAYTCLSYVWGEAPAESDIVQIILHGQTFWIRRNLWNFLDRARAHPDLQDRLFWIDAIYINQLDLLEKQRQVAQMGKIYRKANSVVCWLGEPDPHMERALAHLHGEDKDDDKIKRSVRYLLNCDYLTRLWVVQEVLLASDILLKFGDFEFTWSEDWTLWMYVQPPCVNLSMSSYNSWRTMKARVPHRVVDLRTQPSLSRCRAFLILHWAINMKQHDRKTHDLIDLLPDLEQQKCKNPLDRIYGLLDLVTYVPVVPDYTKTTVELYDDIIQYALRLGKLVTDPKDCASSASRAGDRCEQRRCRFPKVLQRVLLVSDRDVYLSISNLVVYPTTKDVAWYMIHPYSRNCVFHVSCGKLKLDGLHGPRDGESRHGGGT